MGVLAGADSSVAVSTSSTWSSRIEGGRAGRGSSLSPSSRNRINLDRQRFTVPCDTPSSAAISLFVPPSAHRSTILDLSARNCAVFARRAQRVRSARSASESTSSGLGRPGRGSSIRPATRRATNRERHLRTVSALTLRSVATRAFGTPAAHARTIRARSASRGSTAPSAQRDNSANSASESLTSTARGPGDMTTHILKPEISGASH